MKTYDKTGMYVAHRTSHTQTQIKWNYMRTNKTWKCHELSDNVNRNASPEQIDIEYERNGNSKRKRARKDSERVMGSEKEQGAEYEKQASELEMAKRKFEIMRFVFFYANHLHFSSSLCTILRLKPNKKDWNKQTNK